MVKTVKKPEPSQLQRKGRFRDFDDMLSESRGDTITIRVFGKDYTCDASMPAYVPVMMARYADDPVMSRKITYDAADLLFGEEAVSEWLQHAEMTVEKMDTLIMQVFSMIYGGDPEDAEPQEVNEGDEGVKNAPK